ncbi:hypothetical protein GCM10028791_42820 [Echinicola sediminis]
MEIEAKGLVERLNEINNQIDDLSLLVGGDTGIPPLKSQLYQANYLQFQATVERLNSFLQKKTRDFDRAQVLYEEKVIAFAEFDEIQINYLQAQKELDLVNKKQQAIWNQELYKLKEERLKLKGELELLDKKKEQLQIRANEAGVLSYVENIKPGDYVFPNQRLAEISPEGELRAYTYVIPSDIGFIQKGQEVLFQVETYDYNQWGLASGRVKEVGKDISILPDGSAGFLVICEIDQKALSLSNGRIGSLKKGMTFNARYTVTRRSLFDLLYDKADDWMNPAVN